MSIASGKLALACLSVSVVLAVSGCASTSSTRAKSLKSTSAQANSLADCQDITVTAFTVPGHGKVDASVGVSFAKDIELRLSRDFGQIFDSVEFGDAARGVEKECLLQGSITKYKPGSRVARAILIGLGAASFEGNVSVNDAATGTSLMTAPFDKLWAWGGIAGASKGIDDMVKETSASVAATVARAKGWSGEAPK